MVYSNYVYVDLNSTFKLSIDGVYVVMGYDVWVYFPVYKLVCAELVCTNKWIICGLNLIIWEHGLFHLWSQFNHSLAWIALSVLLV